MMRTKFISEFAEKAMRIRNKWILHIKIYITKTILENALLLLDKLLSKNIFFPISIEIHYFRDGKPCKIECSKLQGYKLIID